MKAPDELYDCGDGLMPEVIAGMYSYDKLEPLTAQERGEVGELIAKAALENFFSEQGLTFVDLLPGKDSHQPGADAAYYLPETGEIWLVEVKHHSSISPDAFENAYERKDEWLARITQDLAPQVQEILDAYGLSASDLERAIETGNVHLLAMTTNDHLSPDEVEKLEALGFEYIPVAAPQDISDAMMISDIDIIQPEPSDLLCQESGNPFCPIGDPDEPIAMNDFIFYEPLKEPLMSECDIDDSHIGAHLLDFDTMTDDHNWDTQLCSLETVGDNWDSDIGIGFDAMNQNWLPEAGFSGFDTVAFSWHDGFSSDSGCGGFGQYNPMIDTGYGVGDL